MSGTDYRALCAELLADYEEHLYRSVLADRARTALAQPEPEVVGPTDQELADAFAEGCRDGSKAGEPPFLGGARAVLARYAHQPAPAAETDAILALAAIIREVDGNHSLGAAALAEAILSHRDSRWGQQPAPPAEGEVAELVAALRSQAIDCTCDHLTSGDLRRAADLLERQAAPVLEPALARINDILNDSGRILQTDELEALELARRALEQRHPAPVLVAPYREIADLVVWLEDHSAECFELDHPEWAKSIAKAAKFLHLYLKAAAVPVPVSERLPGPEDCDAEGRCWWFCLKCPGEHSYWILAKEVYCEPTYWLPAHALPLPSGEGAAMSTPNRLPLWKAMDRAAYPQPHPPGHNYRAAEIRALRDWLVPEEPELPGYLKGSEYHVRQIERQRLRALLSTEADRAERGDG